MAKLTDYLEREAIERLAAAFAEEAQAAVRITAPDGELLAGPWGGAEGPASAPVMLDGEHVGTIALVPAAPPAGQPEGFLPGDGRRLVGLMAQGVGALCRQGRQLHERVEELAAMVRLAEAFTGTTDLGDLHRLAAETMIKATGTDACSIRVLSEDRTELLTVAAVGLSHDYMSKGPIRLADSVIDQEVLRTGGCVYVADERTDERVLYKAEARREGIVSALCAPMSYRDRIEGIIRVYTKKPHAFDWFETAVIRVAASQAASAIVNARLYLDALEAESIRRQVRLAGEVQRRMIPQGPPRIEGLQIAAIYVPCFELGGDFYDFVELPRGNLAVAVADVVGKGVPASLLMASARSALRARVPYIYELSRMLRDLNEQFCAEIQEGDFLTLFYGVVDAPNRRLTYCNAGHEPPLLVRSGQATELTVGAGLVGMDPKMRFEQAAVALQRGDVLVMYTDGLPEAINFRDEPFGRRRVREEAIEACGRGESAEGVARHLLWQMRRFTGLQTRGDDLTLVAIKVQ